MPYRYRTADSGQLSGNGSARDEYFAPLSARTQSRGCGFVSQEPQSFGVP